MNVFIVYCHPSRTSFTYLVRKEFVRGLEEAGHKVTVSDLYEMNFQTDITEDEYLRETYYKYNTPVSKDVEIEQQKIQNADAVVFIYPVFWTEAPAKLVGWFDRVWTTGFAYTPEPTMKTLDKVLFIAAAGKSSEMLMETEEGKAMKIVMLNDRIRDRAKQKELVFLDNVTHYNEEVRDKKVKEHLNQVYRMGLNF